MSYKRVIIREYGGPEVLEVIEEISLPEPKAGEVLVKVLASSAAFTDTLVRKGSYPDLKGKKLPFSPGYDMVGRVDKLGEGVTKVELGQQVAELTVTGAYSEYICLHEDRLVPVPNELDPAEAVSLILSYMTAYQMMHRLASVKQGQRILVHGAGGAVGSALVQLGKLLDLEMYGTGSSSKQELISNLGAIPIDYTKEDFVKRIREMADDGIDAAFDMTTVRNFNHSFSLLKKGGTLVWYGLYSFDTLLEKLSIPFGMAELYVRDFFSRTRSKKFYSIAPLRKNNADWFYEDLTELFKLLSEEKIKPVVWKRMPLEEAAHAHKLIEQRVIKGKLVLTMNEEMKH